MNLDNCLLCLEPIYIPPMIGLITMSLKMNNLKIKILNLIGILIFSCGNLAHNLYFIDMWIMLKFLLVDVGYLCYKMWKKKKENLFGEDITSKSQNYSESVIESDESYSSYSYPPANENYVLDQFEMDVYLKDFSKIFTEEDFKRFLSIGEKRVRKRSVRLTREGDVFDKVFYFAKVPAMKSAILTAKDIDIAYLEEGAWIGVIEFIFMTTNHKLDKWLIDVSLKSDKKEVIYYEWDVRALKNLIDHSFHYNLINKLFLIWLKYLCFSVRSLNNHLSNAIKAITTGDKTARSISIPLYRYLSGVRKKSTFEVKEDIEGSESDE